MPARSVCGLFLLLAFSAGAADVERCAKVSDRVFCRTETVPTVRVPPPVVAAPEVKASRKAAPRIQLSESERRRLLMEDEALTAPPPDRMLHNVTTGATCHLIGDFLSCF